MKIIFLANPAAGGSLKKTKKIINTCAHKLGLSEGKDFRLDLTWEDDPEEQACEAFEQAPTVVAAGGDGTVHNLIQGYVKSGKEDSRIGVFPGGTANDLFRHVGSFRQFAKDPVNGLVNVLSGSEQEVGVWQVGHKYFINYFSIGYDADISCRFDRIRDSISSERSRFRNYLSYTMSGLLNIFHNMKQGISFETEGVTIRSAKSLLVANISSYAGGSVVPDKEIDELICFDVRHLWDYLRLLATRLTGRPSKKVPTHIIKDGVLYTEGEGCIQIDGEAFDLKDFDRKMNVTYKTSVKVLSPENSV